MDKSLCIPYINCFSVCMYLYICAYIYCLYTQSLYTLFYLFYNFLFALPFSFSFPHLFVTLLITLSKYLQYIINDISPSQMRKVLLVSWGYCNELPQLKPTQTYSLRVLKSEVQNQCPWAQIQVLAGLCSTEAL